MTDIKKNRFEKGDTVEFNGYKAKVYDLENFLGEEKVLIRFFGRHSLDLVRPDELTLIKKGKENE